MSSTAYNISITPTSPDNFFQHDPDPSLDHLDPSILTSPAIHFDDPNLSESTAEYLGYLDLATRASHVSAIVDFAAATLRLLGFRAPKTTVATRYIIPLTVCGEKRAAQTDVCIIHRPSTILLVLVEDKTIFNNTPAFDVEAQVVAEAIAAFQFNNGKRADNGRSILEAMTIPCITMSGTTPTFYLVPVTKELSDAVITGHYPTSPTHALKRVSDGMADMEFRKIALKRFLAFKALAKSHWQRYIVV
ncbi:hypothetical protein FA15DRAFT_691481 [Coprinopsis marcescibilis]|uniref:Fungal-type protein kinase domain-containing protein n=1 Tax=Coprinopsis marcescibilis TaxID=230819 RepID=A0A5C3L8C6_COPMA|nr:hypothetical protein FA15DRAFT_691481 [Coprinopsis marcescibilis]